MTDYVTLKIIPNHVNSKLMYLKTYFIWRKLTHADNREKNEFTIILIKKRIEVVFLSKIETV